MAETEKTGGEKKLSVTPSKTLSLKARSIEQGLVKQAFSHGRTKTVVVEKVRSRTAPKAKAEPPVAPDPVAKRPAPTARTGSPAPAPSAAPAAAAKPSGVVL